jgi:hypothetical protein
MSEINPRERERERAVVSLHVGEKRAASDPSMGLCEDDQRAQRLITYGCGGTTAPPAHITLMSCRRLLPAGVGPLPLQRPRGSVVGHLHMDEECTSLSRRARATCTVPAPKDRREAG